MTTDTWVPGIPLFPDSDITAERLYELKGGDCPCAQGGWTPAYCAQVSWDAAKWPVPELRYDLDEDEA